MLQQTNESELRRLRMLARANDWDRLSHQLGNELQRQVLEK